MGLFSVQISSQFTPEGWLASQQSEIADLFERAADQLESFGVRVRAGSLKSTTLCDQERGIELTPARVRAGSSGTEFFFAFRASIRRGPARYELALNLVAPYSLALLSRLGEQYSAEWKHILERACLWIVRDTRIEKLTNIESFLVPNSQIIRVVATYAAGDTSHSLLEGLLLMLLLYRCLLDEGCGAGNMRAHLSKLSHHLGNRLPTVNSTIRPLAD
jgi:hypothetical protein